MSAKEIEELKKRIEKLEQANSQPIKEKTKRTASGFAAWINQSKIFEKLKSLEKFKDNKHKDNMKIAANVYKMVKDGEKSIDEAIKEL